ncbi:MAG: alpha/beta hydrolase-fold protein [Pirellulales bacterium]
MWTEVTIADHPADLFEPSKPSEHGYVALYLHGVHGGRLVDKRPFIEQFERHGLRVIAPHTGPCYWADRVCPAFDPRLTPQRHVLDNIMPEIERRWGVRPPRIGLFGTSMGGQGALRLAFKHPDAFPVVAGIAPAIDYQIRFDQGAEWAMLPQMYTDADDCRQDTATLHVHPLNWPRNTFFCCDPADRLWFESAERLHMKMSALGVPHEWDLETTAGGHGFAYYNAMAEKTIGWLFAALEKERRRS